MKKISLFVVISLLVFLSPPSAHAFIPTQNQLSSVMKIIGQEKVTGLHTFKDSIWGSGYFISTSGDILTNAHVVLRESTYEPLDRYVICLTVTMAQPDCRYLATLKIADADSDIALLTLQSYDINGIYVSPLIHTIIWSDTVINIGQDINILGYPDIGDDTITQTRGIISGFLYNKSSPASIEWIKTDAKISEGNSGGAAFNDDGAFIGMPNYIRTGTENLGLLRSASFIQNWKNTVGTKTSQTAGPVIIKEIPDYINDLQAQSYEQSVELTWSAPMVSSEIQYYEVVYDTSPIYTIDDTTGDATHLPHYFTTPETNVTISDLSNDTEYYFYVRPVTTTGKTSEYWSNEAYATPGILSHETDLFTDVNGSHANFRALSYLKQQGTIQGYADGSFKPDNPINRAELIKLLVLGQHIDPDPFQYKNCFKDVKEQWYAAYICYAKDQKWISGYPNGNFKPADTVNRVESLKMILNTYGFTINSKGTSRYTDILVNSWYYPYVITAEEEQILEEVELLLPGATMHRAQIAENIYRASLLQDARGSSPVLQRSVPDSDLSRYFPLQVGSVWTYQRGENANDTVKLSVTGTCEEKSECFTLEGETMDYRYEQNASRVEGTQITLKNAHTKTVDYSSPETIFSSRNWENYFKLEEPATMFEKSESPLTFQDGINCFSILGFEQINTIDGLKNALKIHTTDLVRVSLGNTLSNDPSLNGMIRIETDKYFVEDIGLVKSVSKTTLIQGKDVTDFGTETETLTSYTVP